MTAVMAVLVSELDNSFLKIELKKYSKTVKGNHCPSVVTVKAVLKEIGIRQRQRKGFDYPTANESLEQLSRATAISKSAVSDALRFCEWVGLCETVRKGGGPNKVPTVRRLVTTGFPVKKLNELKGELSNHNGEVPDQNGAFPQTPKDLPIDSNLFFDTYESKLNRDDAELASALAESSIDFDRVFSEWCEKFCLEDEKVTEQLRASAESLVYSDLPHFLDDLNER